MEQAYSLYQRCYVSHPWWKFAWTVFFLSLPPFSPFSFQKPPKTTTRGYEVTVDIETMERQQKPCAKKAFCKKWLIKKWMMGFNVRGQGSLSEVHMSTICPEVDSIRDSSWQQFSFIQFIGYQITYGHDHLSFTDFWFQPRTYPSPPPHSRAIPVPGPFTAQWDMGGGDLGSPSYFYTPTSDNPNGVILAIFLDAHKNGQS